MLVMQLAPLSYYEPGLTLCKGCSFCGALVLVYDRQSLTVYSLVHGLCPPHFAKMHNTFGQSFILLCNAVITLCTYAQQGYAFWLHRFICMYIYIYIYLFIYLFIYMYMSTKNRLFTALLLENLLLNVF